MHRYNGHMDKFSVKRFIERIHLQYSSGSKKQVSLKIQKSKILIFLSIFDFTETFHFSPLVIKFSRISLQFFI